MLLFGACCVLCVICCCLLFVGYRLFVDVCCLFVGVVRCLSCVVSLRLAFVFVVALLIAVVCCSFLLFRVCLFIVRLFVVR